MDASLQGIGFGQMREAGECAEITIAEDDLLVAGAIGVRDEDDVIIFAGCVLLAANPNGGFRTGLVLAVDDAEFVTGGSGFFENAELAFGNEGTTAAAVADEINYKDSPALEFRELKGSLNATHGRCIDFESAFPCRREAVEGEGRVDGFKVLAVVVKGVDAVDLDKEFLDILGGNLERHGILRGVEGLVLRQKIDIDAVLEALDCGGPQHGEPLLRVANAVNKFRFGKEGLEVTVLEVVNEAVDVLVFLEKVSQIVPDKWFFIVDGRDLDAVLKVLALLNIAGVLLTNEGVPELGLKVVSGAWKIEIFEKECTVVVSCGLTGLEDFVQDGGLECIVSRRKPTDKLKQAIEVLFLFLRVVPDVDVVGRSETFEVGVDKMGVVEEFGFEFQKFVVLGKQEIVMNCVRSETAGVFVAKVFDDPFCKVGYVRAKYTSKPVTKPGLIVTRWIELPDTAVLDVGHGIVAKGTFEKGVVGNDFGVDFDGMRRFPAFDPFGMIEVNVQLILDVGQRFSGVFFVIQQSLAIQYFPNSASDFVAGNPCLYDLVKLRLISPILSIQCMVIIVIPRPWYQLLQSLLPILRNTKLFHIPDVPCREIERKDQ